ncbi:hypothetical protein ACHWQZ_G009401 [Mnemiopsis leidyi]
MTEEQLGVEWVILNSTLLLISVILCYLGYGFIFSEMKGDKVRDMVRTEQCWGISLGVSDIMAASLTIPIFLSGLILQEDFLPRWLCHLAGFVDNLYLATSIWSIVMWSVCRYIFIRNPLSPHHLQVTRVLILCVWICAGFVALIPLLFSMPYEFSAYSLTCSSNSPHYNLGLGLLTIVLSLSVITVIFSLTFHITSRIDRPMSRKTSTSVMYEELPNVPPPARNMRRSRRSINFGTIAKQNVDGALSARLEEFQREGHENVGRCKEAADEVLEIPEIQTFASIKEVRKPNMALPNKWHTESCIEKVPHKMTSSVSAETVCSDMISPALTGISFKWSTIPPCKRSMQVTELNGDRKKEKRKTLTGSKRTLVVLTCLFATQVVSLLPIFLLFLLVHYSGNISLVPSQEVIILMTTLMVCNTGLNPMIRIVIVPSYNTMFVMKTKNMCSKVVKLFTLIRTARLWRSDDNAGQNVRAIE